jgi:hypothetical protein
VYTASPEWRNRFRSTAFHNTIRVDGEEINRLPSALALWSLRNDAVPFDVGLRAGEDEDELVAAHTGYRRLSDPISVSRKFSFDRTKARLVIRDRIAGAAPHQLEFFFHAAPGGKGETNADGSILLRWAGGLQVGITPRAPKAVSWRRVPGWFSPSYGIRLERESWIASVEAPLPFEAEWELVALFDNSSS